MEHEWIRQQMQNKWRRRNKENEMQDWLTKTKKGSTVRINDCSQLKKKSCWSTMMGDHRLSYASQRLNYASSTFELSFFDMY